MSTEQLPEDAERFSITEAPIAPSLGSMLVSTHEQHLKDAIVETVMAWRAVLFDPKVPTNTQNAARMRVLAAATAYERAISQ